MSTYLGIDYGRVHLGLALAEDRLSTPLAELRNTPALAGELAALVAQHNVSHIVCGLPDGPLEDEVKAFAKTLGDKLGLPVILHPETLTTVEAVSALRATGASKKKLAHDHRYAACLILDDYLDLQSSAS